MLAQSKAMTFLMRAEVAKALKDAEPPWRLASPARTGLNLERFVRFILTLALADYGEKPDDLL
jgi:hypothetical protein